MTTILGIIFAFLNYFCCYHLKHVVSSYSTRCLYFPVLWINTQPVNIYSVFFRLHSRNLPNVIPVLSYPGKADLYFKCFFVHLTWVTWMLLRIWCNCSRNKQSLLDETKVTRLTNLTLEPKSCPGISPPIWFVANYTIVHTAIDLPLSKVNSLAYGKFEWNVN